MNTVPFTHAGRTGLIEIHQGNAFVRWAGMGFQAGAATGPLRDVIRRTLSGAVSVEPLSLDTALEAGAEYLERSSYFVDRYQLADGTSAYFCRDCGCQTEDIDGCEHCGAGLEDGMEGRAMQATREDLLRALRLSAASARSNCEFVDALFVELERIWIETGDADVSLISRRIYPDWDTNPADCGNGSDDCDCDCCDEDSDLSEIKSEVAQIRRDIRALANDVARITKKRV